MSDELPGSSQSYCIFAPGKVEPDRRNAIWLPRRSAIRVEIGDPVQPAGVDFRPIVGRDQ
jgi:hypothetical protein